MRTQYIRRKPPKVQKRKWQKVFGIVLLALAALIFIVASTGTTMEERDIGAALPLLGLGLWPLCTKEILI